MTSVAGVAVATGGTGEGELPPHAAIDSIRETTAVLWDQVPKSDFVESLIPIPVFPFISFGPTLTHLSAHFVSGIEWTESPRRCHLRQRDDNPLVCPRFHQCLAGGARKLRSRLHTSLPPAAFSRLLREPFRALSSSRARASGPAHT